jgi:mannan endo-1,4-beta-mannosidase
MSPTPRRRGGANANAFAAGLCLVLVVVANAMLAARAEIGSSDPFVKAEGLQFKLGKDQFVFQGFNAYQLPEGAGDWGPVGKLMVKDILKQARENGLTVLRTFAFAGRLKQNALMTAPGEYNEKMLEALDFVMDEAGKQDIRVVLVLDSYWNTAVDPDETHANGIHKYLQWIKDSKNVTLEVNDFYENEDCQTMYRDHVKFLLERTNSINGRVYKEDPAILSYNIMNEPRCEGCGKVLQNWIDSTAAYVRSIDKNHMITVGEDGFYASEFSDDEHLKMNPGEWANSQGQDFIANHKGKDISYAAIHIWPDDWNHREVRFQHDWILQHILDAEKELKKPFVIEEFGKTREVGEDFDRRNRFLETAFMDAENNVLKGGAVAGTSWWNWYGRGDGRGDGYAIFSEDHSTFEVINKFSERLKKAVKNKDKNAAAFSSKEFNDLYGLLSSEGSVETLAGVSGEAGYSDGKAKKSKFNEPHGVALSADGKNLFVADKENHCIRLVNTETGETSTVAGTAGEPGLLDGSVKEALFNQPVAIAIPGSGKFLLVADAGNNVVRRIDLETGEVSTFVEKETPFGWIGNPQGIACDDSCEKVMLVDSGNSRVLDISRGQVKIIAGPEDKGWEKKGFQDGPADNATFSFPLNAVMSSDGKLAYVASNDNTAIRKVDLVSGEVSTLAGDGTDGKRDSNNIFKEPARFRWPMGVTLTPDNKFLLVADQYNHRIRVVETETGEVRTVAGWVQGFQDGALIAKDTDNVDTFVAAMFNTPRGVAVHSGGDSLDIFVSDSGNHAIRKVHVKLDEKIESSPSPKEACKKYPTGCIDENKIIIRSKGK